MGVALLLTAGAAGGLGAAFLALGAAAAAAAGTGASRAGVAAFADGAADPAAIGAAVGDAPGHPHLTPQELDSIAEVRIHPGLGVGRQQLLVGRVDFLETLGGLRIVAAIRMPAHGQPAVGALPVSRRRIVGYPESQERINVHSG